MLNRWQVIVKKDDYDLVYRLGRETSCDMIKLKARNNGQKISRFGIIVSLKFSGLAVKRNRVKRQIREIIRKNAAKIKSGYDLVFFAQKIAGKTDFKSEEIEKALIKTLEKARLFD